MERSPRSRNWVFTLNNYTDEDEDKIQHLATTYTLYGREVAPETGTPHLQGFLCFINPIRRSSLVRWLPRAFLSPANGSPEENELYCKKSGNYFEAGTRPRTSAEAGAKGGTQKGINYRECIAKAESGDLGWIKENEPKLYLLAKPKLESLFDPHHTPLDGSLLHEWWYGPTGSGKSKLLWELYPKHFPKLINKWWDGYKHEEVVAIEEWSPDCEKTTQALKRWADRYPFPGEIKGGLIKGLRPKKLIVLSNYTIEDSQAARFRHAWFTNPPEETSEDHHSADDEESVDLSFLDGCFDDL